MSANKSVHNTDREILSIATGEWDAIFQDRSTGEIWTRRILTIAAVRDWAVINRAGIEVSRKQLGDDVVPVDLADPFGSLDLIDSPEYVGTIAACADPLDPATGLDLPVKVHRQRKTADGGRTASGMDDASHSHMEGTVNDTPK